MQDKSAVGGGVTLRVAASFNPPLQGDVLPAMPAGSL